MVVLTHGPDTCAAVHPEIGDKARNAASRIHEVAQGLGVSVQGYWVDPTGHAVFIMTDAPSAHAVNQLMIETRLFHWNTIDIRPVITLEEAGPLMAR
jgi:hypothetical protein